MIVEAVPHLGERFAGLFSVQGNLTAEDACLSGRAAGFDDADTFKQHFVDHLWAMAQTHAVMRNYFATALLADPVAMWQLGRDARRMSVGDGPGRAYRGIHPSLYYWSAATTPETTAHWIAQSDLEQRQFTNASHWPMVDQPEETAQAISLFFDRM